MNVEVTNQGAFGSALVTLQPGEEFVSEAGAMYRASGNMDIDVKTRKREGGGLWGALKEGAKAMFAGESFFLSTYRVKDNSPGEAGLAPILQGEVSSLEVGSETWICAGGSFMGASGGVELDTQYQGLKKGMFSGEGLVYVRASGQGELLVSAYGRISEVEVRGGITIDNGHIVAFSEGLEYDIGKAGGWIASALSGEGLVMKFRGNGRILVQSHDRDRLGGALGPLLPPREG